MSKFLDLLLNLDREVLLSINGWHSPVADKIMLFFSAIPVWIPLYILVAVLMFCPKWQRVNVKRSSWIIGGVSLLAVGVCFGLCDQISVLIKESVQRYRPSHEPTLDGLVRVIEGRGALYGFVSSHAANTFGFALFTSMLFRRRSYTIPIFIWATIVAYSRVYLAKHYPLDVLCGALLGLLMGYLCYRLLVLILNSEVFTKKQGSSERCDSN